ncbi:MAG: AAA family ATPase [Gammaproteobacteria bacterium]|nr:AAA family ATPase [Gammaproteobacteria bacterium]MCY4219747.1 AAA family ATPase [Gammaproteobacteria bacterium]MCY4273879.1 AAA family ATPase [Gammaproteobacteria bacterium]
MSIHLEDRANHVLNQLYNIEEDFYLESLPPVTSALKRLQNILRRIHREMGKQVVVLVDKYDQPVLNVLENPTKARANRDSLRNLYSILKDAKERAHPLCIRDRRHDVFQN